ncbi:adenine phosphoribosyltransferase [Streptomyces iconiensis]|uniref:Adenine phosphoribosyltransferase n=1 Tax=Streptomyces iconiensis TaxID=1384038 RepID=A0ABT6ZNB5_9ACTN|nr:adenine phosphoribosyltransferase [Streptomyces iconiensis]MDJ1130536.1 adenine phosphoribosyltransferase [Streptomyces iconiensis]
MEHTSPDANAAVLSTIRDVPGFPDPGITFKDITPLLADPVAFAAAVAAMAEPFAGRTDKVAGIEARGFLFGVSLAARLGLGFVPLRKAGKLPGRTLAESYALEYGEATLEVHQDAFQPTDRVLVVDDILATGGTAAAAVRLVRRTGASVAGFTALLALDLLPEWPGLADVTTHFVLPRSAG